MDWRAILKRDLPWFMPRSYSSRYETLHDALSDTFAAVAENVLRSFDHDDAWPSYVKGDLSSAYVRNPTETAVVLQVDRKVLILLCSGLAEILLDYCALAGRLAEARLPDDWTGDAEHLDEWPSLAPAWERHGLGARGRRYAHGVLLSALEYVALHEVAHVELGHLEEMAGDGPNFFAEGEAAAPLSPLSRCDLLHREFEADLWALQLSLEGWVKRGFSGDADNLLGPITLGWMLTLLALDGGDALSTQSAKSHPAPVHRGMFLDEVFLEGAATAFELDQLDLRHLLDRTWLHVSDVAQASGKVRGHWWGDSNARMGLASYPRVRNSFARYYSHKLNAGRLPRELRSAL